MIRGNDPSHLSMFYMATEPLIRKAHKEPIGASDLLPLAPFMRTETIANQFEEMMRGIVWRKLKDESLSGDSDDHFVRLNTKEEVAEAIATCKDKPRLYMLQGYSLYFLVARFVAWHFFLACLLCIVRFGTTILQIWSLWTIIRIVMREPNYLYSTGVQYVIALLLPIGAIFLCFSVENAIHACTRAVLISRSVLTSLIFDKLCILTPCTSRSGRRGRKRTPRWR